MGRFHADLKILDTKMAVRHQTFPLLGFRIC
jgi:hypothetical protein